MTADRSEKGLYFEDGEDFDFLVSEDQAYYRQIEEHFLALRGSPLTLSELDSRLAKSWFDEGVPVELVCRTIDEVFEKREKAGKDKVSSLRYLKTAIGRAWKRHQEIHATVEGQDGFPGEEPTLDLPTRLQGLAGALPEAIPEVDRWRREIRSLEGDPERVESSLAELDSRLLQEVAEGLRPEQQREVEARLASALESLATRLPQAELEKAEAGLREQILRSWLELPVLSLFAPVPRSGDEDLESPDLS